MAEGHLERRQRNFGHSNAVGEGHAGGLEGVRALSEDLSDAASNLGVKLGIGPSKDTRTKKVGIGTLQSAPLKRWNPRHTLACDWPAAMTCLDRGLFTRKIPILALKLAATAVGGVRQRLSRYALE